MDKLTANDLDIINISLRHGYLIPHSNIRKLVAENERLSNRLRLAEHALGAANPNTVEDPGFRLKCLCIEPEKFWPWYEQVLKEDGA